MIFFRNLKKVFYKIERVKTKTRQFCLKSLFLIILCFKKVQRFFLNHFDRSRVFARGFVQSNINRISKFHELQKILQRNCQIHISLFFFCMNRLAFEKSNNDFLVHVSINFHLFLLLLVKNKTRPLFSHLKMLCKYFNNFLFFYRGNSCPP